MGGGGQGSMQSTTVTSNIPEYAKPYVENMLGAAEQQIFSTGPDGSYTGYRPYQPYSVRPQDYFAGPSQAQQQSYAEALGMQTPGQFSTGTGLAALAGTGQLGLTETAGRYGAMGANYGNQAAQLSGMGFGAGQGYDAKVTNPALFQPYMSPYVNQVIQPQLAKAQTDYEMASTQANLASARQGAYGGARQALQQSEREKGLAINKSNIIGQGLQSAYDKAMQSIQFGSGLGLQGLTAGYQGLGMGLQGAGLGLQGVGTQQQGLAGAAATGANLANIGTAQQQSDLSRLQLQNAMGSQQQDYQQSIINQAVQDYATAQQYPYMQLGMMSSLLRGLPIQNMTTQQYQAQPSLVQQGAGLLGAYGAYKGAFKEGGAVKRYDVGGSIERKVKKMAETDPSGKGLSGLMAQSRSPRIKQIIAEELATNKPVRMAEGGAAPARRNTLKEQLESMNEAYATMGVPAPGQGGVRQNKLMQMLDEQQAGAPERYEEDARLRKAMAFLEFGRNPYGPLRGAIEGGRQFLTSEAGARRDLRASELQRAQAMANIEGSNVAAAQGQIGGAQTMLNRQGEMERKAALEREKMASREGIAERSAAARLQAAGISAGAAGQRAKLSRETQMEIARMRQQGLLPKGTTTKSARGGKGLWEGYGDKDALNDSKLADSLTKRVTDIQQNITMAKAANQDATQHEENLARLQPILEGAAARAAKFYGGDTSPPESGATTAAPTGAAPMYIHPEDYSKIAQQIAAQPESYKEFARHLGKDTVDMILQQYSPPKAGSIPR